jgi:hypothetical protein
MKKSGFKFFLVGLVVLTGLLSMGATGAYALDLTGTWKGVQVCESFQGNNEGGKSGEAFSTTLSISQNGTDLNLRDETTTVLYSGKVIEDPDDADKGEIVFVNCYINPNLTGDNELVRAKVITHGSKGSTTAVFTAISIFSGDDANFAATCTWMYKRISTADPEVPSCGGGE